jgi:hypothetical protein
MLVVSRRVYENLKKAQIYKINNSREYFFELYLCNYTHLRVSGHIISSH